MTNKKVTGFILSVTLWFTVSQASAQTYAESALTFSRKNPAGSARIQGIGGAQTSLGGDYSSAYANPAGLGMYNRSEATLSLGFSNHHSKSSFMGSQGEDFKTRLNIPGFSLVFHNPKDEGSFIGGTFGVTYTRTNNFNQAANYGAYNGQSSIVDYFLEDAFGFTTTQFDEGGNNYNTLTWLAYQNYLIGPASTLDPAFPDDEYFSDINETDSSPIQHESISTKGASGQWNISYGANLGDRLFLGAGLGIASIRWKSRKVFTEEFTDPNLFLNDFNLTENLTLQGAGINLTLGAIARPINMLQLGVSLTTATYYSINETYSASLESDWDDFDYYGDGTEILNNVSAETDVLVDEYNLKVPMRFSTGATFITKFGFISADLEFTNPGKAKYSSSLGDFSFSADNEDIANSYQPTVNFRLGGELRLDIFRIRAGYGIQGNSYQSPDLNNTVNSFSAGFGVRTKQFFVDFAYTIRKLSDQVYIPYSSIYSNFSTPSVNFKDRMSMGMITFGFTY